MIDAAEQLIADRGIGNVSVRDITSAAGVNTAAVNYHFGTKEGLLEAIVQRHAEQFASRRAELLKDVPEDDITLDLVVRALVVATAELAADAENGGRLFLACKQRMHADPAALALLERYFEPYTTEFLRALTQVTPHLPRDVRVLRFALARDAVDRAFSTDAYPGWIERRVGDLFDHDEYTEQVIKFVSAGFAAEA
jgi:AcrR family transcriptional regulator